MTPRTRPRPSCAFLVLAGAALTLFLLSFLACGGDPVGPEGEPHVHNGARYYHPGEFDYTNTCTGSQLVGGEDPSFVFGLLPANDTLGVLLVTGTMYQVISVNDGQPFTVLVGPDAGIYVAGQDSVLMLPIANRWLREPTPLVWRREPQKLIADIQDSCASLRIVLFRQGTKP